MSLKVAGWIAIFLGFILFVYAASPYMNTHDPEYDRVLERLQREIDQHDAVIRRNNALLGIDTPPPPIKRAAFISPAEAKIAGPCLIFVGIVLLWMARMRFVSGTLSR